MHKNKLGTDVPPTFKKSKTSVRPKLIVNTPGDKYEQEADAMADKVMRMSSDETTHQLKPMTGLIGKSVQRKCAHCEEEQRKPIMRKTENGNPGMQISSSFTSSLNASKGGGSRLQNGKKSVMENAFSTDFSNNALPSSLQTGLEQLSGFDLSGVKVHRNSDKPSQISALAYTQGRDIYLGPGQEKHLPHEGWHAVQQMQGRVQPTMNHNGEAVNDDTGLEREADVMGAKALQMKGVGQATTESTHQGSTLLQRKDKVIQRILPAWFVAHAGEWLAAGALGFAAADNIAGSTEGDIKYTFARMRGVLLPGGGADIASYRQSNPRRPIFRARHDLAVWYGLKWWRKMGLKFSIYFNYDNHAIGNISMGIVERLDSPGWAGNIDISITPQSLSSGAASVRMITNMVTHNSWFVPDDEGHLVFTLRADGDLSHTGQGGDTPHNKIG